MFNSLNKLFQQLLRFKSDFQRLFFQNEYNTLGGGSSNKGIITLTTILLFTLLALSFAIGSLERLAARMDNPFTNWVNMPVDYAYKEKIPDLKAYFDIEANRDSFLIKNYSPYSSFPMSFVKSDRTSSMVAFGRTIEPEDDLTKVILQIDEDEEGLSSEDFCGIIVTKRLLNTLGYDNPDNQKKILVGFPKDGDEDGFFNVYLDIIAIVDELPDKTDFACHPRLYNINLKPFDKTGFIQTEGTANSYSFYFLADDAIKEEVEKVIKEQFPDLNKLKEVPFVINEQENWHQYEVIFNQLHTMNEHEEIFQQLQTSLKDLSTTQFFIPTDCKPSIEYLERPHRIAFNFQELIRVRNFKNFLKERFDIEISMAQVESKENFALVSRLTFIISVVLFFFGTASIVFFVDSLLKTHLQKVKTNLGTFKAFGLDNNFLVSTYLKIILVFLSIASVTAFLLSTLVIIAEEFLMKESYFNLFNGWVLLAIVVLFIISLLQSRQTIRRILTHTPGDLIYNRV